MAPASAQAGAGALSVTGDSAQNKVHSQRATTSELLEIERRHYAESGSADDSLALTFRAATN